MALEDARIGGLVLVGDNLHGREIFGQARGGELALLVEDIALGDEDQPVRLLQLIERLVDIGQGLDRIGQQFAAGGQDFGDHRAGHAVVGDIQGGFHHGKGEALHAEAIEGEIAGDRGDEARIEIGRVGIVPEQIGEALFGDAEKLLVLPERVVGIEGDGGDGHGWPRGEVGVESARWLYHIHDVIPALSRDPSRDCRTAARSRCEGTSQHLRMGPGSRPG
ncbi:hypothetical protein D3C72_1701650 [compost metagenome]